MYIVVSVIGGILRQIYLPNPFVKIFDSQGVADIFNLFGGSFIIGVLSYMLTGCIYNRGEAPIVGSVLYTFNYALITFSFYGITLLINDIVIAIMIYLAIYFTLCIILSNIRNKQHNFLI